jgi:hypothetical protein
MHNPRIDELDADLQAQMKNLPIVQLSIEHLQGSLYAWDAETNKFLAQGTTPDALFERLAEQTTESVMYRVDRAGTELLKTLALELENQFEENSNTA